MVPVRSIWGASMKMKGFFRLRGAAAIGAISLGPLWAGSVRAAPTTTAVNIAKSFAVSAVSWTRIENDSRLFSNVNTLMTTSLGFAYSQTSVHVGSYFHNGAFGIFDAALYTSGDHYNDAFDSTMNLAVGNKFFINPSNSVDLTDDTLTSGTMVNIIPGIDAQIQYYFSPAAPVVRALFTFTNTTSADIDTHVLVTGNFGSDAATLIQNTSNGDTNLNSTDMWYVTNDSGLIGSDDIGDPALVTTRFGVGALVTPVNVFQPGTGRAEDFGERYDLTIPAGQTVRLLNFHQLGVSIADLSDAAASFQSLANASAAGHLAGLSPATLASIVNYDFDSDGDGVLNRIDAFPTDPNEFSDTDGDGVGDNADNSDSNGIEDSPPAKSNKGGGGALGLAVLLLGLLGLGRRLLRINRR